MNYQSIIRKRIKEKYKSIENFSNQVGIPRTTVNFILKNGIEASNYKAVTTILDTLDIPRDLKQDAPYDERLKKLIETYTLLDDFGKHTVDAVAQTELRRISGVKEDNAVIAAYESITDSSNLTQDEKHILELVRKIKETDKN